VICPDCNVENPATARNCTICQHPLLELAPVRDGFKWFGISAGIVVAFFIVCAVLGMPSATLVLGAFYAALLTSYLSPANRVWHSAFGALAGAVMILFIAFINNWPKYKLLLAGFITDEDRTRRAPSTMALVLGFVFVLLAILPAGLIGASVGEHLAHRRRAKRS
jgi:hypothetical protein